MDRIENFDEITPREVYNRGYDDGLRRGMEIVEIERLRYQHVMRQHEYLIKKLSEFDLMRPLIVQFNSKHELLPTGESSK